jgi:hypothetical protein
MAKRTHVGPVQQGAIASTSRDSSTEDLLEQQGTGDRVPLREAMGAGDLQRPVTGVSRGAGGQGGTGNRDSVRVT